MIMINKQIIPKGHKKLRSLKKSGVLLKDVLAPRKHFFPGFFATLYRKTNHAEVPLLQKVKLLLNISLNSLIKQNKPSKC